MGILKDITDEIAAIKEKAIAEESEWKAKLTTLNTASDKAREDYAASITDCDEAGAKKAAQKIREAGDVAGMYEKKLEKLAEDPLIDKAKYDDMCAEVYAYLDEVNRAAVEDLNARIAEIEEIIESVEAEISEGNGLLHTIQHELLKDDCMVQAGKNKIHMASRENTYKKGDLIGAKRTLDKLKFRIEKLSALL